MSISGYAGVEFPLDLPLIRFLLAKRDPPSSPAIDGLGVLGHIKGSCASAPAAPPLTRPALSKLWQLQANAADCARTLMRPGFE
ncbi:MAG TPA: hypothetical protein VI197_28255 [Polyangiaceae bacterium]